MSKPPYRRYTDAVTYSREMFREFVERNEGKISKEFYERFCGYGVGMTNSVSGWIRKSGERCVELGYTDLGHKLIGHAAHEDGHHLMMLADLNALGGNPGIAEPPWPTVVNRYREMHEWCMTGNHPYCQLAIELEIERLSVLYGPRLLKDAPVPLSFVESHVNLDMAHTSMNERMMREFLNEYPERVSKMASCAAAALAAYTMFLKLCLDGYS